MMYRYLSNENTQIVYSSKMVLMHAAMGQFSLNNKEKRARPQACKEFQIIEISWGKLVSLSHPFSVMRTVSSILIPPTPGM